MKTEDTNPNSGPLRGSERSAESMRNAEPKSSERKKFEWERPAQDDLVLHDDDEAELDLPR